MNNNAMNTLDDVSWCREEFLKDITVSGIAGSHDVSILNLVR
jgi:hypothetical protein